MGIVMRQAAPRILILCFLILGGGPAPLTAATWRIGVPSPSVSYFPAIVAAKMGFFADEGVPARQFAEVIGRRLNVPVVSKSREDMADHFGWIGQFFAMDGPASSEWTQKRLNWQPKEPGLLADLDQPHYFAARVASVA